MKDKNKIKYLIREYLIRNVDGFNTKSPMIDDFKMEIQNEVLVVIPIINNLPPLAPISLNSLLVGLCDLITNLQNNIAELNDW